MKKTFNILVTRPLSDDQVQLAKTLGLEVDIEPAIEIEYRSDWFAIETNLKTIENPVLAFTSQHGVKALQQFLESGGSLPRDVPVYAVGEKTAETLAEIKLQASLPEQQDGIGLAQKIIRDFADTPGLKDAIILHFCGDKRRDEFRQFLADSEIRVRDMVVYNTILTSMNLPPRHYDGILFYSPSAVQAYRNSGGFRKPPAAEFFAIGSTTAEELSIESGKHVHVSPEPDTGIFLTFVAKVLGRHDA